MLHWRFITRQITRSPHQTTVLVVAVALSIMSFVALRGFATSINEVVLRDARQLLAADVQIRSNYPISTPLLERLQQMRAAGRIRSANTYEFVSMVRKTNDGKTLLAELKVVDDGYPFYSEVEVRSGVSLAQMLRPGVAIVEASLLERLNARVGAGLQIGDATFTIADVIISEPDRPVDFFRLGPRVILSSVDLERMNLIGPTSRVTYRTLIQVADGATVGEVVDELESVRNNGEETIVTFATAQSTLQRFYENFLSYLAIVGVFTLVLSGIGMQVALTAFLREQRDTVAVIKTVGASGRFVLLQYMVSILLLGVAGSAVGILGGVGLQRLMPILLSDLLPADFRTVYSFRIMAESTVLGIGVAIIFTFLPLFRLEDLKPNYIFRREQGSSRRYWLIYLAWAAVAVVFTLSVLIQMQDWRTGLYFVGGMLGLLLIAASIAEFLLQLLRRLPGNPLDFRQALRSLFRPGNSTRPIVVSLAASTTVLFCMVLVEQSLDASLVRSFPADAPNFFVIDIQPDQQEVVAKTLRDEASFYPIVRATVAAINGKPQRTDDGERGGQNWQYALTYRNHLLEGEELSQGRSLFDAENSGPQVSVLDDVRDSVPVYLGDTITFRIQGVSLQAKVTSIRALHPDSTGPFFSFVLAPADLRGAPQTLFATTRVAEDSIASLQDELVAQFPNLTAIDITATVKTLVAVAARLSRLIRLFALVSLLAGILIVISAIYATRLARIEEAAYYKVLGAPRRFVLQVFTLENVLICGIGVGIGALLAQIGNYAINRWIFELPFRPSWTTVLVLFVVTTVIVSATGVAATLPIIRSKPIHYLRRQQET